ncbi:hypothetical protein GCM10009648_01140 [Tsukamurella spumae]
MAIVHDRVRERVGEEDEHPDGGGQRGNGDDENERDRRRHDDADECGRIPLSQRCLVGVHHRLIVRLGPCRPLARRLPRPRPPAAVPGRRGPAGPLGHNDSVTI